MNIKAVFSMFFTIAISNLMFADGLDGPSTGTGTPPPPETPIDTNSIILIVAAVLLTVGVIAYKKLSLKKA